MNRVLITGGAAGIGLRLAERFREAGAQVAICDADAAAVKALKDRNLLDIVSCVDVADEAAMSAFLDQVQEEFGGIDVVCANAGMAISVADGITHEQGFEKERESLESGQAFTSFKKLLELSN